MSTNTQLKPSESAEQSLIHAILDGIYQPGAKLPAERELAVSLGVTRPTLREALSRLDRDGWILIQHGKATLVNDFWRDGALNVLAAIVQSGRPLPPGFIVKLLEVREVLAPAYTRAAIEHNAEAVVEFLGDIPLDDPEALARYDWELHRHLCQLSNNPIYTLILNGFQELYLRLGVGYFHISRARRLSQDFYQDLHELALENKAAEAEELTRDVMHRSIAYWKKLEKELS